MNEKIEAIKEWIEKADHDLGTAKVIYLQIPEYFDIIAYHCQQAVEKYLKALVINIEIYPPRTHNLMQLLDILTNNYEISNSLYAKAAILNNFSTEIRYPNKTIYLSPEDLKTGIEISEEFRKFVIDIIGLE